MGFKRPFDGEELQGLTFKQSRASSTDKLNHFSAVRKSVLDKEETLIRSMEDFEEYDLKIEDVGKVIDSNFPFSELHAHDVSTSNFLPCDDVYISHLNHSPRKQVPVGSDHQADIPCFNMDLQVIERDCRDELVGTCILSMPDSESFNGSEIGVGRKTCSCPDMNSVRCVRQHIMEARENVRRSIGHEKFVDLGFFEMGEEVACHWSEEEERIFHGVVYANPASLGYNLWKRLFEVFPSRPTKEIVSFYFNVFMLRRRASQNRSSFLDIDSDDDEWHGIRKNTSNPCTNECRIDDDKEVDDDGSSDDSDGDNGDIVDCNETATEDESSFDSLSAVNEGNLFVDGRGDYLLQFSEKRNETSNGDPSLHEDSCLSFEFSPDEVTKNETSEKFYTPSQVFLLDSCDSKLWDDRGFDLLPTCNIIEEIFGQGNCSSDL